MDLKEKLEILKNRAVKTKIRMRGEKFYKTRVIKALVIDAQGNIVIHDMIASAKKMGFAYQINEIWREINPESKLNFDGHSAYVYIGNCMMPIKFSGKAFMPIEQFIKTAKKTTKKVINAEGYEDEIEAYEGIRFKGRGYYFAEPINFKRIMEAKLLGELMTKVDANKAIINWTIILIGGAIAIWILFKNVFGIDLLAGAGGG